MNKLEHKKNIIQKLIILYSEDLKSFLILTQNAQGILPKSTIQKMVEYCNERKNIIIGLNNRLIELIQRGEQIESKH